MNLKMKIRVASSAKIRIIFVENMVLVLRAIYPRSVANRRHFLDAILLPLRHQCHLSLFNRKRTQGCTRSM
jgi:hypothetical protein